MFFTKEEPVVGVLQVETAAVIESCQRTLRSIKKSRERYTRKHIREIFKANVFWWRRVWRWFGFPKPTRSASEKQFWKERDSWFALCLHGNQEDLCTSLLAAAKKTACDHMWLAPSTIVECNYQKPKESQNESRKIRSDAGPFSDYRD